jgi:hypothetical protein
MNKNNLKSKAVKKRVYAVDTPLKIDKSIFKDKPKIKSKKIYATDTPVKVDKSIFKNTIVKKPKVVFDFKAGEYDPFGLKKKRRKGQ